MANADVNNRSVQLVADYPDASEKKIARQKDIDKQFRAMLDLFVAAAPADMLLMHSNSQVQLFKNGGYQVRIHELETDTVWLVGNAKLRYCQISTETGRYYHEMWSYRLPWLPKGRHAAYSRLFAQLIALVDTLKNDCITVPVEPRQARG